MLVSKGLGSSSHNALPCIDCMTYASRADYRLDDIGQEEAEWAIQTAQEIIAIAEQKDPEMPHRTKKAKSRGPA